MKKYQSNATRLERCMSQGILAVGVLFSVAAYFNMESFERPLLASDPMQSHINNPHINSDYMNSTYVDGQVQFDDDLHSAFTCSDLNELIESTVVAKNQGVEESVVLSAYYSGDLLFDSVVDDVVSSTYEEIHSEPAIVANCHRNVIMI
ncbi:hypothetical protein N9R79_06145 [Vibrio sp.]|nr:hypothetical protein [Vibrio sp.]